MGLADLPVVRDVPSLGAAQMAEVDHRASEELGISLDVLMENASRQIAAAVAEVLGDLDGSVVAAVAGTGNNGGDALGALPFLEERGAVVDAYVAGPANGLRPLARSRYDSLKARDVPIYDTTAIAHRTLTHRLRVRQAVLDGLLGYSSHGAPRGEVARLVRLVSAMSGPRIIAVDLPSGLDPDTGETAGDAIRASLTITLGLPKTGLLRPAARPFVGELLLADIGIPPQAYAPLGIEADRLFASGSLLRVAL